MTPGSFENTLSFAVAMTVAITSTTSLVKTIIGFNSRARTLRLLREDLEGLGLCRSRGLFSWLSNFYFFKKSLLANTQLEGGQSGCRLKITTVHYYDTQDMYRDEGGGAFWEGGGSNPPTRSRGLASGRQKLGNAAAAEKPQCQRPGVQESSSR
ncbi:hypothetical protein CI238_11998 [Colletotrichum incanum]|uniref:Uncharacterized protein n=1 Tax=Colletotrichum incanum TaxID=1573173 RepID=A0A167CQD5_COLIC|nr:hypothetical protein CI238_11998 [Colletotrichum incanum]